MKALVLLATSVLVTACADSDPRLPELWVYPEEIQIPAGTFMMGMEGHQPDELPVHEVSVAAFFIDTTEVTVAAYQHCVDASVCTPGTSYLEGPINCNTGRLDRDDHPINCVDPLQASTYCDWRGKRLPTEEEWEYAARGTDSRVYPWGWGLVTDEPCWSGDTEKRESTCPVGQFPKDRSPFGVLGLGGNVSERTASLYTPNYQSQPTKAWPIIRGGTFRAYVGPQLRATSRRPEMVDLRSSDLGFRCARSGEGPPEL